MLKKSWLRLGALLALLLVVASAPSAYATTITVDGDPSDWPGGSSVGTDPADVTTPFAEPEVDISEVFFTNDTTYMYWRIDTYGTPTRWDDGGSGFPILFVCLDTDNNTGTGITIASCGSQAGVDYRIRLDGNGPSSITPTLRQCATAACSTLVAGADISAAAVGNVTEIRVRLSDMGITTNRSVPSAIYFDNRELPNDDNTPNSGTFPTIVPGPTPVTLTSFTAARGAGGVELAWASSSELNIQGYHVLRSAGDRAAATRITDALIPGTGSGITGGSYSYTDTTAAVGSSYSYWLEVVNSDGTPEEYGPVSYAPGTAQRTSVYLPLVVR